MAVSYKEQLKNRSLFEFDNNGSEDKQKER